MVPRIDAAAILAEFCGGGVEKCAPGGGVGGTVEESEARSFTRFRGFSMTAQGNGAGGMLALGNARTSPPGNTTARLHAEARVPHREI